MKPSSAQGRNREPWRRYLPWRGRIEVALWALAFAIPAVANTLVVLMDARHDGEALPAWQPALWEGSSALVSLLLLPALLALCSRFPLHADTWRRRLPAYVLASMAWSVLHVAGMVLLRKAGYLLTGEHYAIDDWLRRFAYEYLKDARTFALIVVLDHGYRWFWRRLQGRLPGLRPPMIRGPRAGSHRIHRKAAGPSWFRGRHPRNSHRSRSSTELRMHAPLPSGTSNRLAPRPDSPGLPKPRFAGSAACAAYR